MPLLFNLREDGEFRGESGKASSEPRHEVVFPGGKLYFAVRDCFTNDLAVGSMCF